MGYIYKITNKLNNKVYIGQTICQPSKRWYHHLADANLGSNVKFHRALRKYGKDNFTRDIIEEIDDELLDEREIYWIEYYDSFKNGYNSTKGGDVVPRNDIPVICLETFLVYASCEKAQQDTGINKVHIAECARYADKRATAGGYHWMSLSEYETKGPIYRTLGNALNSKSVICVETGKVYKSILEASKDTGIARATIHKHLTGEQTDGFKHKYHWRYNDNK